MGSLTDKSNALLSPSGDPDITSVSYSWSSSALNGKLDSAPPSKSSSFSIQEFITRNKLGIIAWLVFVSTWAFVCRHSEAYPLVLSIIVLGLAIDSIRRFFPAHLTFGPLGFRIHWLYGKLSTRVIPWDTINYVSAREYQKGRSTCQTLDFGVEPLKLSMWSWLLMCLVLNPLSIPFRLRNRRSRRSSTFSIRNSQLPRRGDLSKVFDAFQQFLPKEKIDPSTELLTRPADFTSIWLDQLQSITDKIAPREIGALLHSDRYEVVEPIGSGGQAVTYLAIDRSTGDRVVLKEFVLPVTGGREITKNALEHIEEESKLIRSLDHPRIVKCFDQFCDGRRAYMVLNYIEGPTLAKRVKSFGPMSESEVVKVALQLCDIVGYLHHRIPPIVHRDLTPENLIIQDDGTVVLIDFNVAKELDPIATTHTIVGKHSYIPPEQFRGNANTQSDIYAMGGTFFWLLTGQEPEPISVAHPRDIAAHVSAWMDQLVATATEQDLNCRFKSIEDMQEALASRVS